MSTEEASATNTTSSPSETETDNNSSNSFFVLDFTGSQLDLNTDSQKSSVENMWPRKNSSKSCKVVEPSGDTVDMFQVENDDIAEIVKIDTTCSDSDVEIVETDKPDVEIVETDKPDVITIDDSTDFEECILEEENGTPETGHSFKLEKIYPLRSSRNQTNIQCVSCLVFFADKLSLQKHLALKEKTGGKCSLTVPLSFLNNKQTKELYEHYKEIHTENEAVACVDNEHDKEVSSVNKEVTCSGDAQRIKRKSDNNETKKTKKQKTSDSDFPCEINIVTNEDSKNKQKPSFKCDYCGLVLLRWKKMEKHLKGMRHTSASLVMVDNEGKPEFSVRVSALWHGQYLWKTAAIICTVESCGLMFNYPTVCVEHHRMCHDTSLGANNEYGIVDIVGRNLVVIRSESPVCTICSESFTSMKLLTAHQKALGHLPYKERPDCSHFFLCQYCNVAPACFSAMYTHNCPKFCRTGKKDFIASIVYYKKNVKTMCYEPFTADTKGQKESLRSKLMSLQTLSKSVNSKSLKRKMNTEISCLKKIKSTVCTI